MSDPHYKINAEDDGCWIATVSNLKYCSAHGDTPAEAAAQVQVAIEGWLETARETGLAIPKPRYRPAAA